MCLHANPDATSRLRRRKSPTIRCWKRLVRYSTSLRSPVYGSPVYHGRWHAGWHKAFPWPLPKPELQDGKGPVNFGIHVFLRKADALAEVTHNVWMQLQVAVPVMCRVADLVACGETNTGQASAVFTKVWLAKADHDQALGRQHKPRKRKAQTA